jgi:hypothetical protein
MEFLVGSGIFILFVVLVRMGWGGVKIILPEDEVNDEEDEDEKEVQETNIKQKNK